MLHVGLTCIKSSENDSNTTGFEIVNNFKEARLATAIRVSLKYVASVIDHLSEKRRAQGMTLVAKLGWATKVKMGHVWRLAISLLQTINDILDAQKQAALLLRTHYKDDRTELSSDLLRSLLGEEAADERKIPNWVVEELKEKETLKNIYKPY